MRGAAGGGGWAIGEQQGEFVAADASGEILAAAGLADDFGDLAEQRVASGVAGGVVDGLEEIEIDKAEGVLAQLVPGLVDHGDQGALEGEAVGEPGERVMHGGMGQLLLQSAAAGDILEHQHGAQHLARWAQQRRGRALYVAALGMPTDKTDIGIKMRDRAFGEAAGDGTGRSLACCLFDDGKDLIERTSHGFGLSPAGHLLGGGVHEGDAALGVDGNDAIANRLQGDPEAFLFGSQLGFDALEMGDVGIGADGAYDIALGIPFHRLAAAEDPDVVAVAATLAIFERVKPGLPLTLLASGHGKSAAIVGMHAGEPLFGRVVDDLVEPDAAHGAP